MVLAPGHRDRLIDFPRLQPAVDAPAESGATDTAPSRSGTAMGTAGYIAPPVESLPFSILVLGYGDLNAATEWIGKGPVGRSGEHVALHVHLSAGPYSAEPWFVDIVRRVDITPRCTHMAPEEPCRHGDVTELLRALRCGERRALDDLLPLVYDELRRLARRQIAREPAPRTLHATGLVHEAYLKLAGGGAVEAADRAHFLAIAARAMRQVLVDHSRRRRAVRRGGEWASATLTEGIRSTEFDRDEMLALNQALEQLEPRQRHIVECRFFAGMEDQEIAAALGLTERTVRRDWVKARAWLYRALYGHPHD